jgi:hypothetical protein
MGLTVGAALAAILFFCEVGKNKKIAAKAAPTKTIALDDLVKGIERNPIAAKAAPAVLVLACTALLAWALLRTNAAWNFFAAETIAEHMYEAGEFPTASLDAAQARLDKALARYPGNPDYLGLAGNLKELRASQPGVVGLEHRELLEAAAQDYRDALAVRPLWPYTWVNLLSAKDKLGQVDSEFNTAMHKAAETGPWEPRVQLQLLRSGVRHWEQLRRPERDLVQATAASALQSQPREVFEVARFYFRPDLVCGAESPQPQIEKWCAQVLEQSNNRL